MHPRYIMLLFSACPICKSILPRESILCESCADKLWALREPVVREESGFRVRSLFAWREESPPALDWLIRSLKGKDNPEHWNELSLWMITSFHQAHRPLELPLLVPIPSKRPHAMGLSRSLRKWTRWPLDQPLSAPDKPWQKSLSREARQGVEFHARQIDCTDYKSVVIVDDVITTGATLKAAYLALGRPRSCEAWCLMDRRPCGS